MATLLKSEAAFEERARECGLPSEELERLKAAGIKTISLLAFSTCAPGAQPSEDQLRALLRPLAPESLGVGVVAAIRHLMFECQTLCLAHVKASVEGSELAPAERTTRILNQKAKMQGLTLVGQLECSYASYDYVGAMLEKTVPCTWSLIALTHGPLRLPASVLERNSSWIITAFPFVTKLINASVPSRTLSPSLRLCRGDL